MYEIVFTGQFKKDLKRVGRRKMDDLSLVQDTIKLLKHAGAEGVPRKMKPNRLKGNYDNHWECHIKPDLLIIWFQIENPKTIRLIRIGTHSDLFK
ncbi:type II toxin-antitoxin system YafQ family toxin [Maribacter sp. 2307ULW6-5]|uniref:type II toxin-antitoxin system YafQ family toxin n=1 Tax=Maribacter sp. 2307ULW6-5 TaxID=3386275 RepID=UPI0039BCC209